MKLTLTISVAAATILATASANAQILVAGWDASIYSQAANTIDNATLTGAVASNYSQLEAVTASGPNSRGVFYYDGTNGSDNLIGNGQNGGLVPVDNSLFANALTPDNVTMSAFGTYNTLIANGQAFAQDLKIRFTSNSSFVIFADASALTTDWELSFAGLDADGSTISFAAGTDGVNYGTNLGSVILDAQDKAYTIDASALDGNSAIYIRGTFSNIALAAYVDNFQVTGSVIPEPSTFALAFGAVGIAAALRRRRRA